MSSFEELGLHAKVLSAVKAMGYTEPTPVQEQAIPLVLEGSDVLAAAQTGTGKTAAFVLPILDKLGHFKKGHGPKCLIVTPTRELAEQIDSVARTVAKKTGHYVLTVVGGLSYNPQIAGLRKGIDVLVATPGRLLDLYDRGDLQLDDIEVLVLDEADRMLDMGFWPDVSKIIEAVPNERQTLLFSATLDDSVMKTIGKSVRDPKHVEIARKGTTAETITQYVVPIAQNQKNEFLEALLDEKGAERVIIFTRTKSRAEVLAERLNSEGFSAEAIHGDRSQAQRSRALRNFREGNVGVIVATDVLARGIDVSDVDHVINYDVPTDPEDYIHRIGRTGRAGEEGYAVTLLTKSEIFDFACIEHLMKRTVAELEFENFDFNENRPELDPNRDPNKLPRKGGKGKEKSGKNEKSGRKREDRERTREHGEGAFREGDRSGRIERQGSKHNAGQGNKLRTKKIEARVERVAANSAILEGEQVPSRAKRRAESFSNEAKRQERIERRQKPAKAKPVKEKPAKANHPGKKDKPAAKKAESAGTKAAETKTSAERRSAYARKPQTKPAQQETSRKRRPGDRGGKR